MPGASYLSPAERVGLLKGEMLRSAEPREVLGITGNQHMIPKNSSKTVVYRRWLPYGGATTNSTTINRWTVDALAHETQEGVTPTAESIAPQDVRVTLKEYSCLYMYTNQVADLHEDDIPAAMVKQTGQRMGLVREMLRYGALKGCTNKFYAGGTSRATVDEAISLSLLRRVTRSLIGNRGDLITQILAAGPDFNTTSVEAAFLVFCHSDCENDIRNLPGFKETSVYAQRKVVHPLELGSVDRYRFIVSPELASIPDAGAAVGATGLLSTSAAFIDIYPVIVVGDDAWGDVSLKGTSGFKPTHIRANVPTKSDPHGQRGYVGAIFYAAPFIQNDGWMCVAEVGVASLA